MARAAKRQRQMAAGATLALGLGLALARASAGQELHVVSFDTSGDAVVSAAAMLLTAQGAQYGGVLLASASVATAESFANQLADGVTNLAIVDLSNGQPNGDWAGALGAFVADGGCAIVTVREALDAALVAGALGATVGAAHDVLPISRWNSSPLFDSYQVLPTTLPVADNVLEPNGFLLEPAGGASAAAGFVADPTPNQAAIVVGNGGRTILHGFLADDLYPGDADGDTLADATELAENEIFAVGIAGCTVGAPGAVEVPTLGATGAAGFALALAGAAALVLRRRRLREL